MPRSSEIIIADTSCLILLQKIAELDLIKSLSKTVYITQTIQEEFGKPLPSWIRVAIPKNKNYQAILEMELDPGEASAIALSLESPKSILIIDDLKGRKVADKLGIHYSGTFGLILKAKQEGIVKTIRPILSKIAQTDFRFSQSLLDTILKEADEL